MTSATVGAIDIVAWFVYLFSAVLFVVGLHFMNSPKTARKGNQISAFGMVVAVLMAFIVLFAKGFVNIVAVVVLVVGILIGAVAGVVSAKKVKMTDMPQLVSVFNTVGGGAAALVALNDILTSAETPSIVVLITAGLGIMIGSVTFSGSLIAAGKLQGIKWVKKLSLPGKGFWNILFVVLTIVSFVMLCVQPNQRLLWSILTTVFALCYGLVFVIPIGGADMPVVIYVLNACTGTAVAMSGLAINNIALIVAGALVGAAGVTLSIAMSKAMNRPLLSVLAGGFGGSNSAAGAGEGLEGTMKETSADDLAVQLVYAEKVIFVPGFGLAQAQAQRELADLGTLLKEGDTLTKSHLADVIYEQFGLPKRFCKEIVDLFFDEALECLVRGEELKLSNFGVFSIKQKSERPGRNPKSGESAIIKARQVVSFHPSGQLRKEVVEGRKHAAIALQASGAR